MSARQEDLPARAPTRSDTPIGLVTITYSPGEQLADLLDSIPAATDRDVVVVLADNGSTDGSVEVAAKRPGVQLLRTGGNIGYGAAANAGVAALDPAIGWVVVINPDVVLGEGSIDALLAAAARHPEGGAFGPLITTPEGVVYPSARHLPSIGLGVGHALFGWWWPSNPWTRVYRQDMTEPVERTAGWLSGSCLLLRRAAFDAVRGFDPGYFMYFEDVDLGDRLGRAGWTNVYCPSAQGGARGRALHRTSAGADGTGAPPLRLPVPVPAVPGALAGAAAVGAAGRAGRQGTAVTAVGEGGGRRGHPGPQGRLKAVRSGGRCRRPRLAGHDHRPRHRHGGVDVHRGAHFRRSDAGEAPAAGPGEDGFGTFQRSQHGVASSGAPERPGR